MSRIPQSFLDDLLARVDIVELIDHAVPLKKSGSNYTARCPFHEEKSPSFSVNANKQFYHCFGCKASGNAIGFLMAFERLDFLDAVEQLAKQVGLEMPRVSQATAEERGTQVLYDLLTAAKEYYEKQLRHSPEAIAYLKRRGISGETAKRFALGFATSDWQQVQKIRAAEHWVQAGLLIQQNDKTYDRFRERLMFPIHDKRGRVIGFGGRVLDNSLPKYLNSPETPVFHKGYELYGLYEARKANRELPYLFIVEGYMDVVSLAEHGITNAVATLGTATTDAHIQTLLRHTSQLIFCFDGDLAGRKAAARALEHLLPQLQDGINVRFMFLAETEDPDTFVKTHGKAAFEALANTALSLSDFFFQQQSEGLDLSTHEGRAALHERAKSQLSRIPTGTYQQLLYQELAKRTRTEPVLKEKPIPILRGNKPIKKLSPLRTALMLLVQSPKLIQHVPTFVIPPSHAGADIWHEVTTLLQTNPTLSTASLIERYRDTPLESTLTQLAFLEHNIPETGIEIEFMDALERLKEQDIEANIESLLAKMANKTASLDEKKQLQELIVARNK